MPASQPGTVITMTDNDLKTRPVPFAAAAPPPASDQFVGDGTPNAPEVPRKRTVMDRIRTPVVAAIGGGILILGAGFGAAFAVGHGTGGGGQSAVQDGPGGQGFGGQGQGQGFGGGPGNQNGIGPNGTGPNGTGQDGTGTGDADAAITT